MNNPTCTVGDCDKPRRSPGADYCTKHYHRWYRHGDPLKTARGADISTRKPRKYRARSAPGHPLADKRGRAWEHQLALYDRIGEHGNSCHWCDRPLDWYAPKGDPAKLHVDHLNGQTDDNDPANLVPSCNGCNSGRGGQERAAALRAAGWWSSHDTIARLTTGTRREPIRPAT